MSYFRLAGPDKAVHGNHLFTLPLAQPCTLNRIEAPEAIKRDIPIISEIEFASQFTNSDVLAITGSNGKSTTVPIRTSDS